MKALVIWITIMFCLVNIVFYGCKKYDDGPALSLRTKAQRLAGQWDVKTLISDGRILIPNYSQENTFICSSLQTITYFNSGERKEVWEFDRDSILLIRSQVKGTFPNAQMMYDSCIAYYTDFGPFNSEQLTTWKFAFDKKKIIVGDVIWDIKELKNDEMRFERTEIFAPFAKEEIVFTKR